MALTGNKLIHANSSVAAATPTAGQMVQGQIAINNADKIIFIKDSTNTIVAVASASALAKALSSVQTVNGQSPVAGAVTLTPAEIGAFGVAPLDASSKIPTVYLPDSVLGAVSYQGTWDASTNTPTLPDPTTSKGFYYVVTVAGTQFTIDFTVGDWVISNGTEWEKVDAQSTVTSVNGQQGAVVLTASSVGALGLTGGGTVAGTVIFTGTVTVPAPVNDTDASTKKYVDDSIAAIPAGGTVTSIDVTSADTSVLTATGGPVTLSGAITLDFATQVANTVFAGPGTGADAKPTFRALVAADIPTIDEGTF